MSFQRAVPLPPIRDIFPQIPDHGPCCASSIEAKMDKIIERMDRAELRASYDRLTREWDQRRGRR